MAEWAPVAIDVYRRILIAARLGRGVLVTADEVRALAQDPSVTNAVFEANLANGEQSDG